MKYYGINNNGIVELHKVEGVPSFAKTSRPTLGENDFGFRIKNSTSLQFNTWNGVCWVLDNGFPDTSYCLPVSFIKGKYMSTNQGVGNVCPMTETTAAGNVYAKIDIAEGTIIRIEGVGGYGNRTWAFVDKTDSTIISVAPAITSTQANAPIIYLVAPANAYLIINLRDEKAIPPYNNNKKTPYSAFMFSDTSFSDANEVTGYGYIRTNDKGLQVIFDGAMWICGDGYPDVLRCGETTDRPTLPTGKYIGFQYFDKTLGKPIYWNGTAWVDATGVPTTNSLKVLSISQTDYDNLGTYDSSTLYVITST